MNIRNFYVLILILTAVSTSAQRFNILAGKPENLKGITEYNVVFDYAGLSVFGYDSEEAYLQEMMKKRVEKGTGDEFRGHWFADREAIYEPAFINYFNERFQDGKIKAGRNPQANYTMTVKTVWIYPGYNVGIAEEPPKISAVVTVSETANPANVLLSIEFPKSVGFEKHQGRATRGERIATVYEKIAKNIVMQIKRFN